MRAGMERCNPNATQLVATARHAATPAGRVLREGVQVSDMTRYETDPAGRPSAGFRFCGVSPSSHGALVGQSIGPGNALHHSRYLTTSCAGILRSDVP